MVNNKKKEELQSRREFFKSAAKAALPVIGAIALVNIPSLSVASELRSGCDYCEGSCSGFCEGCKGGCDGTCKGGCEDSCRGHCDTTCKGGCGAVAA